MTTTAKTRTYIQSGWEVQANQATAMWTETNGSNYDIKVLSVVEPSMDNIMRHGKSFGSTGELPFIF